MQVNDVKESDDIQANDMILCQKNKDDSTKTDTVIINVKKNNKMTFQEFANREGITYEAVRRRVLKFQDELTEHIIQQGNVKYLDEYAVNFLQENSRKSSSPELQPLIAAQRELAVLQYENERLKQEQERLKQENAKLQKTCEKWKNTCADLEKEKQRYITELASTEQKNNSDEDYKKLMERYIQSLEDNDKRLKQQVDLLEKRYGIAQKRIRVLEHPEEYSLSLDDDADTE